MLIFFAVGALLPPILDVVVWWRLRHLFEGALSLNWRRQVAYFGLVANFLAYAIPWVTLIYNYILSNRGRPVGAEEFIDGLAATKFSLALAALSLVLGVMAPKQVRVQLILSAVCVAIFLVSIPMGVL
ncbi:MAG TPA: hypothetical protein VLV89_07135 [Candidatus Acidoferrum sp.]|nr:hypothetical protein [Candidatus Acidoferrum sp.]